MNHLIDWKLLNDDKVIIDLKNVIGEYIKDDYLLFKEEDAINKIDLKNKLYERKSTDYTMKIDFKSNICNFKLPEKEDLSFDIEGSIINKENEINIKYSYDKEIKEIKVIMKEEV